MSAARLRRRSAGRVIAQKCPGVGFGESAQSSLLPDHEEGGQRQPTGDIVAGVTGHSETSDSINGSGER